MNGAVRTVVKVSGDHDTSSSLNGGGRVTPYDSSYVLATRPSRHLSFSSFLLSSPYFKFDISIQVLSYWTCSKLCAICFVGGVVFGYTLRGRVKRWASKILKKLS
ncbi:hypothetical protein TSUD_200560 [Trifolium subterraneum]|nr:hypothetical protein TSUD_200560 [Trifolium subterraneum]